MEERVGLLDLPIMHGCVTIHGGRGGGGVRRKEGRLSVQCIIQKWIYSRTSVIRTSFIRILVYPDLKPA